MAQSAISRQVRLLEDSLGQQLLIRSPQSVILTPAGKALYTHSQDFQTWSKAYFQGESQELRIGVMSGIVDSWLIPRLSELKESSLPNLTIAIQNEPGIREQLETGELDMGLLVQPIESETITSRVLFKEDYVVISKKEIDPKKLQHERWIFGTSGRFLKKASKKVSSRFIRVNSVESIIQLVERGMGVAVVPSQILKNKKKLKTYPMSSLGRGNVYLALPNYKMMPDVIQRIVDHLSS